jgi:hypothetical protein
MLLEGNSLSFIYFTCPRSYFYYFNLWCFTGVFFDLVLFVMLSGVEAWFDKLTMTGFQLLYETKQSS